MANDYELKTAYPSQGYAPQLEPGTRDNQLIMDLFKNRQQPDSPQEGDGFTKKEQIKEALLSSRSSAAAGGGLGGMLTSGGLSAGLAGAGPIGWGLMGGGMLLSAIEQKQKEKAAREQSAIDAEMQKRQNLIQLAREAAGSDFRLV